MDALLKRIHFLTRCTIGEFFFDGSKVKVCFILEDVARVDGVKVPGVTCIPSGLKYKISRVYSPKFKMIVPVIYTDIIGKGDTPDDFVIKDDFGNVWKAVEIHAGNSDIDSDACQLPGMEMYPLAQRVLRSRDACTKLYKLIFDALDAGHEINYTIVNAPLNLAA